MNCKYPAAIYCLAARLNLLHLRCKVEGYPHATYSVQTCILMLTWFGWFTLTCSARVIGEPVVLAVPSMV